MAEEIIAKQLAEEDADDDGECAGATWQSLRLRRRMRVHVLKRKSSALEGERGRPVVNIVVVPEFRVASWGEHAACLDVAIADVPIRKPPLADCGGRKEPQRHVFHKQVPPRPRHAHRTHGARAGRDAQGRTRRASHFGSSSSRRRR